MIFEVEMNAFQDGLIREVKVDPQEMAPNDLDQNLEQIFYYGQNDFQPVEGRCSVSVGDVIRFNGSRFLVKGVGFKEVKEDEHNRPLTREERFDMSFDFS
jgi:hypothetical protein